LKYISEKLNQL